MYCPTLFAQNQRESMLNLIRQYPLATVITHSADGQLTADHIPLMYDDAPGCLGRLLGHVARNNPVWQASPEQELLVVFQGSNSYISPNWYATKAENHKVVPTWNYAVVHARCTLRAIHDPEHIRQIVATLTTQQEATQPQPWKVEDAPREFTERLVASIVGIELTVKHLQGKWKVSQNQPPQNQASVVRGLLDHGSDAATGMAQLVETCAKQ